jgi:VWFA-related protein
MRDVFFAALGGFCLMLLSSQYLMQLSEYSGGLVFDALKMDDLGPAFEKIARELSCQYSIGYYPANTKREREFRRIVVKVNRPGLLVRTKKGYFPRNN